MNLDLSLVFELILVPMLIHIHYEFSANVWQHSTTGGWFFVSLPKELTLEIRKNQKWLEEGWGRLKINAKIGKSEWKTALWFDTKLDTYLLAIKAQIRKNEKIVLGSEQIISIWI